MAESTNKTVLRNRTTATSRAGLAQSNGSIHRRVVRGVPHALWSITWTLLAAQALPAQTTEPPLEPIPMPAPVAKAKQVPPQADRQAVELRAENRDMPLSAPRVAPANFQESTSTESTAQPADAQVVEPPVYRLDAPSGEDVIVEPAAPGMLPVDPSGGAVPGPTTYSSPPQVITQETTTARAYYAGPGIQIFLPRSRATYRQTYYPAGAEFPMSIEAPGRRITVFRSPAISVTLGGPPVAPAGFVAPGPIGPPSEFGVVVAPGVIQVGPPPLVPGQPVRNALRAMMW